MNKSTSPNNPARHSLLAGRPCLKSYLNESDLPEFDKDTFQGEHKKKWGPYINEEDNDVVIIPKTISAKTASSTSSSGKAFNNRV